MKEVIVNINNFKQEVIDSNIPVLVDFYADWCGPCMMLSPILEEIANEHEDIKICKVNCDEEYDLCEKFNVSSIPALFIFKNGSVYKQALGYMSKEKVLDLFK